MKKKKQAKKGKASSRALSILFLILAIPLSIMSVVGFACGVILVGVVCLLFAALCFRGYRMMKNEAAAHVHDAAVVETIKETVNAVKPAEVKCNAAAVAEQKESLKDFDTVEIVFPDGHTERRRTWMTIDEDEGCLITDGGNTYHTDVGCFCNWSQRYQDRFTGWQLISLKEAQRRGLRKCNFCIENDKL